MQKSKVAVWWGFTNSWERSKLKGKGERERYTQLNADFQRIARRDRTAFLNKWCKEIEENNRIGKTRDLFKEIGAIKGTFYAKICMIQVKNSRDLTEADEIKSMWQEYTEEIYKILISLITMTEWSLTLSQTSFCVKSSGPSCIPAELFKVLKVDAVNVLHTICQQIWKTPKKKFILKSWRKAMPNNVQTTAQLRFHMLAKLCSKPCKLGFSSMWTENYQKYKLAFEEAEGLEFKLPFAGLWIKQWNSRINNYFCFIDYAKAYDCVDHKNYGS